MNKIIASDFDGVICDGLVEYFHSSQLAYEQIWQESLTDINLKQSQFNLLRPVVETGWEMPVLLRALVLENKPEKILISWQKICQSIVIQENLETGKIGKTLDEVRQTQIKNNLSNWLSLHNFYQGVISQLKYFIASENKLYIITTKEGIFVKELLKQQGINLPDQYIIGKEKKRPKYETLSLIIEEEKVKPEQIYFIEDRLEALELVKQQSDLQGIKLFLANWGYNTVQTRASIMSSEEIKLLSLPEFTSPEFLSF
jgi:3-deoxy-D-manno-octulosonate 8-phosphate phosphatase KdsC-like HAD superfamily phosphatase